MISYLIKPSRSLWGEYASKMKSSMSGDIITGWCSITFVIFLWLEISASSPAQIQGEGIIQRCEEGAMESQLKVCLHDLAIGHFPSIHPSARVSLICPR